MLIYEYDGNVFPLLGEAVEGLFYLAGFGFGVYDEEVALGGGRVGDVL
jgi:hypothetical protein